MRTLYVTYVLSAAAVQSVLGRPSFFQNSGWELVEDEPTLRVETTKHDWGSKDVSITKSEFYETKDGELELELHGSASGHRDEADVQLDYQLLQDTVRLSLSLFHILVSSRAHLSHSVHLHSFASGSRRPNPTETRRAGRSSIRRASPPTRSLGVRRVPEIRPPRTWKAASMSAIPMWMSTALQAPSC